MTQEQKVTQILNSIRQLESIGCDDLRSIFYCLANKMKASGFADIDVENLDEVADFICGETA